MKLMLGSGMRKLFSFIYRQKPNNDNQCKKLIIGSVADPDPGSGAFLPPGSGIRIRDGFFPDL
jgi:hypothetical protein